MSEIVSLEEYKTKWNSWALTTDKSEDGWQALFPDWLKLVAAAERVMVKSELTEADLKNVEFCWSISEEDEPLADFAKKNIKQCWSVVKKLCDSIYPEVRWQAYTVLPSAGVKGELRLRTALRDQHDYSRRRAFLAFIESKTKDSLPVAKKFLKDNDGYLREIAKKVVEELSHSRQD